MDGETVGRWILEVGTRLFEEAWVQGSLSLESIWATHAALLLLLRARCLVCLPGNKRQGQTLNNSSHKSAQDYNSSGLSASMECLLCEFAAD